jgi:hypothetical protein
VQSTDATDAQMSSAPDSDRGGEVLGHVGWVVWSAGRYSSARFSHDQLEQVQLWEHHQEVLEFAAPRML